MSLPDDACAHDPHAQRQSFLHAPSSRDDDPTPECLPGCFDYDGDIALNVLESITFMRLGPSRPKRLVL